MAKDTVRRVIRSVPLFGRQRRAYVDTMPEAELFPDEESRREAVDAARKRIEKDWRFQLGHPIALVVVIFGAMFALRQLGLGIWAGVLGALVAVLVVEPVLFVVLRRLTARDLRAALIDHGILVCERCGYDLRHREGATEPLCPECGAVIVPRTTGAEGPAPDEDAAGGGG